MGEFFQADDFEVTDKLLAVRIDLNSKVDDTVHINERFYAHADAVNHLVGKNARIILLAHQSRKGEPDFVSLKKHAEVFSKVLGHEVKFVDDVIGEKARGAINKLSSGEILMLDNVRFLPDEDVEKSIEEHANSSLVKFLSPLIDYYVLDAFSVAHRSHASIVGFSLVKPTIAGETMRKEIEAIDAVTDPSGSTGWIMGGAKIDDCISVLKNILTKTPDSIEKVLTGGMLANLFMHANGYSIGSGSLLLLKEKGHLKLLDDAKFLMKNFNDKIVLPVDVAFSERGRRVEQKIENIPLSATIFDIGSETVEMYKEMLNDFSSVVVKGPMGKFEDPIFAYGTRELLDKIASSNLLSLIGGGDTSVAIETFKIDKNKFSHISVGGGALISFLSGKPMPGIDALRKSYEKFTQSSL